MSDKMEVYYFSPTGGTKKVSDIFAAAVGKDAEWHDLGDKQTPTEQPQGGADCGCGSGFCRTYSFGRA